MTSFQTTCRQRIVCALLAFAFLLAASSWAANVPRLAGRVNDYANILSKGQRAGLEQALAAFEQKTSNQVVLLTTPSLEGEAIEDYSIAVAEKWKIGQKDRDNGVILVIAPNERKARIEVGYGLEGALTDLESRRIMAGVLIPAFKSGDWYGGISGGLSAIMQATEGEYKGDPNTARRYKKKKSLASSLFTLFFIVIILFTRMGRFFWPALFLFGGGGRGGGGFGGGFSGGGGGFGGGGASGSW